MRKPDWKIPGRGGVHDLVVLALFVLVALRLQMLGIYDASPLVILSGDAGNVTSFLAGWLYPEYFTGDLLLDDRSKFAPYVTLVLPVVALLHQFEAELGLAYLYLAMPVAFFYLLGFYSLGKHLFNHRGYAVALALLSLVPVETIPGDLWGFSQVPYTRTVYAAAFPWLLLLALTCHDHPKRLYLFAGLAGIALYIHPVSGPSVGASCLLGLLVMKPPDVAFPNWIVRVCMAGVLFVLCILPFAWLYLVTFPSSTGSDAVQQVMSAWTAYIDVQYALAQLFDISNRGGFIWNGMWILWLLGIVGLAVGAHDTQPHSRACRFLLLCILGLFLTSIVVAYLDQTINAHFDRGPIQIDLIRNLRYILPLLLIGLLNLVLFVWRAAHNTPEFTRLRGASVLLALFICVSGYRFFAPYVTLGLPYFWSSANTAAVTAPYLSRGSLEALAYLRGLPPGSARVLPITNNLLGLAVRYGAYQPVTWTQKDRNLLVYSSHPDLSKWINRTQLVDRVKLVENLVDGKDVWCELISSSETDLVLVDRNEVGGLALEALEGMSLLVFEQDNIAIRKPQDAACL